MRLATLKKAVLPFLRLRRTTWDIEIYRGASPFAMRNMDSDRNPVLTTADVTDVVADFVADPFIVRDGGVWYMFFEALVKESNKGVICLATSVDALSWTYRRVVLEEPFHLSYPYVFAWQGTHYMIPESAEADSVRLYAATGFPADWSLKGQLLRGLHRDPSIFRHAGMWWMFSETSPDKSGTLRLHGARELAGPWREHPQSPIVEKNPHISRPAGRVIEVGGRPVRLAQDTFPDYGMQIFAFEILELTPTSYREAQIGSKPILKGQKAGFLGDRIHHMDACQVADNEWIAAIDYSRRRLQIGLNR
jgi:hypothetical protein